MVVAINGPVLAAQPPSEYVEHRHRHVYFSLGCMAALNPTAILETHGAVLPNLGAIPNMKTNNNSIRNNNIQSGATSFLKNWVREASVINGETLTNALFVRKLSQQIVLVEKWLADLDHNMDNILDNKHVWLTRLQGLWKVIKSVETPKAYGIGCNTFDTGKTETETAVLKSSLLKLYFKLLLSVNFPEDQDCVAHTVAHAHTHAGVNYYMTQGIPAHLNPSKNGVMLEMLQIYKTNMQTHFDASNFNGGWDSEEATKQLADTPSIFVTMTHENEIIGFAQLMFSQDYDAAQKQTCAYLLELQITPKFQRRGLGQKILTLVDDFAATAGLCKILCTVQRTNQAALRWYVTNGYQIYDGYSPDPETMGCYILVKNKTKLIKVSGAVSVAVPVAVQTSVDVKLNVDNKRQRLRLE